VSLCGEYFLSTSTFLAYTETNARQHLLDTLGFDPNAIAATAAAYTEDPTTNGVGSMSLEDNHGMTKATEDVVKKALLVGNFEAAVECCFRTGNLADALVLASCGGADLWTKTQERYFQSQSQKRPFLSTVSAIIRNELEDLVQNSDPKKWPETLAILSTYGKSDEFPKLCIALGDLLESAGDTRSASLCYMCSLSLERAVTFWRTQLERANTKNGSSDFMALHEFVVKVSVFLKAMGPSAALEAEDAELFSKYASKLAEQGLFVTAAKYSKYVLVSMSLSLGLIITSSTNCLSFFSFPGASPWRVRY
jgi:protein transport protein SEC31